MEHKRHELERAATALAYVRRQLDYAHDAALPDDAHAAHNANDDAREAVDDADEAITHALAALDRHSRRNTPAA